MMPHDPKPPTEGEATRAMTEDELQVLALLDQYFGDPDHPGLCLSEEVAEALHEHFSQDEVDDEEVARLRVGFERAKLDVAFLESQRAKRLTPSLGYYVAFLRKEKQLTPSEVAKNADFEFHTLTQLESGRLPLRQIAARPLARLLWQLGGSKEQTEKLLPNIITAERFQQMGRHDRLYRSSPEARSGRRSSSLPIGEDEGQQHENPEWREEMTIVRRLIDELREAWPPD